MSEREINSILVRAATSSVRRVVPNMLRRWILALAALAALVFVSAGPSRAQSQSAASKSAPAGATTPTNVAAASLAPVAQAAIANPAAAPVAPARQSPAKGQREGITVHGHWTIEVKNPDGTVTARREFENHVVLYGQTILAGLLSGDIVPGAWSIALFGNSSNSGTQCSESTYSGCTPAALALEQGGNYGSSNVSTCTASAGCSLTLLRSWVPPTVPAPATGPNGYFQLSGSAPVTSGVLNISLVATYLMSCTNAQINVVGGFSVAPSTVPSLISPAQCEPSQGFTQLNNAGGGALSPFSATSTGDPLGGGVLTSGSVPLLPVGAPFTAFTLANPNSNPPPAASTPTQVAVSAGQMVSVTVQISFQ